MTENKLICPICQTPLDYSFVTDKVCGCPKCRNIANIDLWQELIKARKALDVAVDALKRVRKCHSYTTDEGFVAYQALYKLGEIKQINQKENQ